MDLLPLVAGALTAIPTALFMTDSIQNSIVNKKKKSRWGCWMQQLYNKTVTSGRTPCFILVFGDQLAGTHSHLSHLWKSGFLDAKTSLSDFSAVLRAVGVLWPSWTHFTDSAAAHFVGMFTYSWFCLGRSEGGGRVGGVTNERKNNKKVTKTFYAALLEAWMIEWAFLSYGYY